MRSNNLVTRSSGTVLRGNPVVGQEPGRQGPAHEDAGEAHPGVPWGIGYPRWHAGLPGSGEETSDRTGQAAVGTELARRQGPPLLTVWASAWMVSLKLVPPASWYSARPSTVATAARACGR